MLGGTALNTSHEEPLYDHLCLSCNYVHVVCDSDGKLMK